MATIEAMTERLDGLERDNRRLRWGMAALLAGVVGLGAVALLIRERGGRTIEAQRLVLRDKEGRLRGSFGVDRAGLPSLKIYDHRGIEQITLGAQSEDFAMLTLSDHGATRVVLDTSIEGATSLRLFDASERERAALFLKPDSEPGLRIAHGDQVVTIGPGPDGRLTMRTTGAEAQQDDPLTPLIESGLDRGLSKTGPTDVPPPPVAHRAEDRGEDHGSRHEARGTTF